MRDELAALRREFPDQAAKADADARAKAAAGADAQAVADADAELAAERENWRRLNPDAPQRQPAAAPPPAPKKAGDMTAQELAASGRALGLSHAVMKAVA